MFSPIVDFGCPNTIDAKKPKSAKARSEPPSNRFPRQGRAKIAWHAAKFTLPPERRLFRSSNSL
jgi:hypothetical protein